jgi:hypothetical protein
LVATRLADRRGSHILHPASPGRCPIRAAIITPNAVTVNGSSMPTTLRSSTGLYGTCANQARHKKVTPSLR